LELVREPLHLLPARRAPAERERRSVRTRLDGAQGNPRKAPYHGANTRWRRLIAPRASRRPRDAHPIGARADVDGSQMLERSALGVDAEARHRAGPLVPREEEGPARVHAEVPRDGATRALVPDERETAVDSDRIDDDAVVSAVRAVEKSAVRRSVKVRAGIRS